MDRRRSSFPPPLNAVLWLFAHGRRIEIHAQIELACLAQQISDKVDRARRKYRCSTLSRTCPALSGRQRSGRIGLTLGLIEPELASERLERCR
jgi:hypothetical protein